MKISTLGTDTYNSANMTHLWKS